ncbi:hypothetical protein FAI41_03875 [Acetobacteraceae bacterium]|nr:hypothetical protein FAI41_03875 [Acetobacteraceae bacterium]
MTNIQKKITAILQERRNELPEIERQLNRLEKLKGNLADLKQAVTVFRQHEGADNQALDNFSTLPFDTVNGNISQAITSLEHLKARFSRPTLNVGVSGRARVGKSTLLQSISGLNDDQIPTGSGLPVTAVRSRIFHSDHLRRAILHLHTYESFRQDVLQPYHDALGLPEAPQTLELFAQYQYPESVSEREASATIILKKIKDMQSSLPSYRSALVGGETEVSLDGLRHYVAYPTSEAEEEGYLHGQVVPRPYLAVKDVRIECPFPYAQVSQLGIIDLPGLGELNANAEEHHLEGLCNDVDLVMLVKRPLEGMAYWGKEDGNATDLLDKARGFVESRRDFVYLVMNIGGADKASIMALRGDILRNVNNGEAGKNFQLLEANAADEKNVYEHVLEPVLTHLAERLPVMDRQIRKKTLAQSAGIVLQVNEILSGIEASFTKGKASNLGSGERETLDDEIKKLLSRLALKLHLELKILKEQVSQDSGKEAEAFEEAVDHAYENICHWIDNGLGDGAEKWSKKAFENLIVESGSGGFVNREFNNIRVEVSNAFSGIDDYFNKTLEEVWKRLGDGILKPSFGILLEGKTGRGVLEKLATLAEEAEEPCPQISRAIKDLLSLRLDYRTQLHHKVRYTLDILQNESVNPKTGDVEPEFAVEKTSSGVEKLLRKMTEKAHSAVYQMRKALMEEYKVPERVIYAAVEQFDDALIRSAVSERELKRLAYSYRDEIWPGIFAGVKAATARTAAVKNAMKAVRQTLA